MVRASVKCFWPIVLLLCLLAPRGQAQVGLALESDRKTYVQYEGVTLRIQVRNVSGNTLDFGQSRLLTGPKDPLAPPPEAQGGLEIEVRDPRNQRLESRKPDFNPAVNLVLAAGASRIVEVPLALLFDLTQEGSYEVQVRARHKRFRSEYASPKLSFTVLSARPVKDLDGRLMSIEVGVPTLGTEVPIATRTASLFSFHTADGDQCGLKVADPQFVYAIVRLGPYLRGTRPQLEVDSRSHIHAMLDIHSRLTGYWIYDLEGQQKQQNYFKFDKLNMARLLRDPDLGRVMVVGAEPAMEGVDFNLSDVPVMSMAGGRGGDLGDEWDRKNRPPPVPGKMDSAMGPEPGDQKGVPAPRPGGGPLPPQAP